jgi:uncharacterized protein YndB with AHSA1/START domain
MYHAVHRKEIMMNTMQVRAIATTRATPQALWALLADATTYADWGPWNASGYEDPAARGEGALRWMRYGRRTTVERILGIEEGRRLVYNVERGIPVRNYRAVVTLTPTAAGTQVDWSAEWDSTLLGRAVHRKLRTLYPEVMASLVAAAEAADARTRAS